jgi:Asp-tRNA(Asn)/Glu-tRNA(Gln) amidotransferase A subunit family amidase
VKIGDDVYYAGVRELGRGLRRGSYTPVDLANAYLDRLEALGPRYGALITLTRERALDEARAAAAELKAGRDRGPLHGIPYGVKDLLAAKGYPTTWGAAPYRDQRIEEDATVVARLRAAGAVLVAKLAMVEIAGGMGYEQADASFTGPGKTPWNPAYWSGGSSSGPGAAVAAAMVPFAIGSETWGSIFFPATACGVTGLRPTYGRVSRRGAMGLSWTMDKIGPMARSAEDCGLVLAAIAGADPKDPTCTARPFAYPGPRRAAGGKLRIGVIKDATLGCQEEVVKNFEAAVEVVGRYATLVPDLELPDLPYGPAAEIIIMAEAASAFQDLLDSGRVAELQAPEDRTYGYVGTAVLATDYIKALRLRGVAARALDEVLAKVDGFLSPTLDTVTYPLGKKFDDAWPTIEIPKGKKPPEIGGGAQNLVGLPGVAVPNGFGKEGLPTSLAFTGRAFGESAILEAAREYQAHTDWHTRRPPV